MTNYFFWKLTTEYMYWHRLFLNANISSSKGILVSFHTSYVHNRLKENGFGLKVDIKYTLAHLRVYRLFIFQLLIYDRTCPRYLRLLAHNVVPYSMFSVRAFTFECSVNFATMIQISLKLRDMGIFVRWKLKFISC